MLDTAGQERFRSITSLHYRKAMGIILVYDVTSLQSFQNIEEWMKNIQKHTSQPVNMILVGQFAIPCTNVELCDFLSNDTFHEMNICFFALTGNKTDLSSQREVSTNEGRNLAGVPPKTLANAHFTYGS